MQAIITAVMPALLIMIFPKGIASKRSMLIRASVEKFVETFFLLECLLAIFEYVAHAHLFGWFDVTYTEGYVDFRYGDFRSVAFLGGPLTNAIVVEVMMLFYLFDRSMKVRKKYMLYLLGMLALFCFNARMAMVISVLAVVLYSSRGMFQLRAKGRFGYFVLIVLSVGVIAFALYSGMGNRLASLGDWEDDGSIAIRLRLFDYLAELDWRHYLWGMSMEGLHREMDWIGVRIIENFWVLYMFHFGIVFTVLWAIGYFCLAKSMMKSMPLYDKIVVALLFVTLASINNSIYSSFYPVFTFLLCCYIHQPKAIIYDYLKK